MRIDPVAAAGNVSVYKYLGSMCDSPLYRVDSLDGALGGRQPLDQL